MASDGNPMVAVAPVSSASRTSRLPFGPWRRTQTTRRPASKMRGYSGKESDGVSLGELFLRKKGEGQPRGLHQPVIDITSVGRVKQQASCQGYLCTWIQTISDNQQPLPTEALSNLFNRLTFHSTLRVSCPASPNKGAYAIQIIRMFLGLV